MPIVYIVVWSHEGPGEEKHFRKPFEDPKKAEAFRAQLIDEGEEAQIVQEKVRTPIKKRWWGA